MKRISTILLAMILVMGLCGVNAAKADGVDIKVKGQWDFVFGYTSKDFRESANGGTGRNLTESGYRARDDRSVARQRVRTQIDFISSEYLSAVLMFEIGDLRWGNTSSGSKTGGGTGADLDADGVNIETKRAYLDWIIPYTEVTVRMGLQSIYLPATALGNPVFTADVAGVTVSSPITDWLSATAFWARPFDQYYNDEISTGFDSLDDEMDMFGLLLPMSFEEAGLSITPWYVYANIGNASGFYNYVFAGSSFNTLDARHSGTKGWWIGANMGFTLLDPLEFNMDFIYGRVNRTDLQSRRFDEIPGSAQAMASGWYIGATLDYKLDFMTPGIFGWYASGDTKSGANANRVGRLPVIAQDDGFTATSFGTNGYYGIGNGDNGAAVMGTGTGTWGLGIQLADMSFIEDLSHTLRFAYYRGTNDADIIKDGVNGADWASVGGFLRYDADPLYLTDKDEVFEINFDHQYKIYENLTMVLELGYIHLRSDKNTWGVENTRLKDNDNAWKAEVNFRYSF